MKLKLNYINKRNKLDKENHLIFVNSKIIRKFDKKIDLKIVLENDLFKEKKFLQKNFDNKNYVFINCIDCKKLNPVKLKERRGRCKVCHDELTEK